MIEINKDSFSGKCEITKDEFCTMVRDIQQYMKETAMIDNTLASIGDGNFSFFKADDLMFHITHLLSLMTQCIESNVFGSYIDIYLFDDSQKLKNQNGKIIETPEELWDFILEDKK